MAFVPGPGPGKDTVLSLSLPPSSLLDLVVPFNPNVEIVSPPPWTTPPIHTSKHPFRSRHSTLVGGQAQRNREWISNRSKSYSLSRTSRTVIVSRVESQSTCAVLDEDEEEAGLLEGRSERERA
jgi:hypothetical protein